MSLGSALPTSSPPRRLPGEPEAAYAARYRAWASSQGVGGFAVGLEVGLPATTMRFGVASGDADDAGAVLGAWPLASSSSMPPPTRGPGAFAPPASGPQGLPGPGGAAALVDLPFSPPDRMGGAVAEGLREPADRSPADLERERVLAATGFDVAWRTPPAVAGLAWNPARLLYEARRDASGLRYRTAERRGVFPQAVRDPARPATWTLRWVEALSPQPDPRRPYRVLSPSEVARAEIEAGRIAPTARGDVGADPWGELRRAERSIEAPGPARPLPTWSQERPPPSHPMGAYAWVAQRDLPVGCPYPYPYLPVPVGDYVSGAWLDPGYAPSIPLPAPYDATPWRCGVPGSPPVEHRKGKQPQGTRISPVVTAPRPPAPPVPGGGEGEGPPPGGGGEAPLVPGAAGGGPHDPVGPEHEASREGGGVAALREALREAERAVERAKAARAAAEHAVERVQAQAEVERRSAEARAIASSLHDAVVEEDRALGLDRYRSLDVGMPPPSGLLASPADAPPAGAPPPPRGGRADERGAPTVDALREALRVADEAVGRAKAARDAAVTPGEVARAELSRRTREAREVAARLDEAVRRASRDAGTDRYAGRPRAPRAYEGNSPSGVDGDSSVGAPSPWRGSPDFVARLRLHVVAAARALQARGLQFSSGAHFAAGESAPGWTVRRTSGTDGRPQLDLVASGRDTADAVEALLDSPSSFALDCVNAAQGALYVGIFSALVEEFGRQGGGQVFSTMFPSIVLGQFVGAAESGGEADGRFDRNLRPLFPHVEPGTGVLPGDFVYVRNPDVNMVTSSAWRGEAVIAVVAGRRVDESTVVVAHGLQPSEVSIGDIVRFLNDRRVAHARTSAYVDNHYRVDPAKMTERVRWAAEAEEVPWRRGR